MMNPNGESTTMSRSALSGQRIEQVTMYQTGWAPSKGQPAESWTEIFDFIQFCQNSVKKIKRYLK